MPQPTSIRLNDDDYYLKRATYKDRCSECFSLIQQGDRILWDSKDKAPYCLSCGGELIPNLMEIADEKLPD